MMSMTILEQNGKISFLPKVQARPANVQDMNIAAKQEKLSFTVVLDGHIMEENLKLSGNNKKWLENELQAKNRQCERWCSSHFATVIIHCRFIKKQTIHQIFTCFSNLRVVTNDVEVIIGPPLTTQA